MKNLAVCLLIASSSYAQKQPFFSIGCGGNGGSAQVGYFLNQLEFQAQASRGLTHPVSQASSMVGYKVGKWRSATILAGGASNWWKDEKSLLKKQQFVPIAALEIRPVPYIYLRIQSDRWFSLGFKFHKNLYGRR